MKKQSSTVRVKKQASIGIRTTPEIKAAAEHAATADRRNMSSWIEGLILDAVAKKQGPTDV